MKSIDVASRKLFFKDVQPEGKEPLATILLVHGAGGSHLSWRRQTRELAAAFRLVLVDLPGHGRSGGAGETTVQGYTRYVVDLMDALGLERVILGGHSMGGAIAVEAALRNPGRLGGLLLAIEGMANFLFGPEPSKDLVEEEKRLLGENSSEILLQDFTACDSFDVKDEVASINLPTLILCGKQDRLTPVKYSEFLHEGIKRSEIVFFDNCGHMPMLEQSDEFNRCVSSFLAGLQ